jgi:hypothetical protein
MTTDADKTTTKAPKIKYKKPSPAQLKKSEQCSKAAKIRNAKAKKDLVPPDEIDSAPAPRKAIVPATGKPLETSQPFPWQISLRGRPTNYTPEIGEYVAEQLSLGRSLKNIVDTARAQDPNFPDYSSFLKFACDPDHHFFEIHRFGRELQWRRYAEQVVEISDDATNDYMVQEGKDGEMSWKINGEHIQRSRLRVDTRKWLLSRVLPKEYGDEVGKESAAQVQINVNAPQPIDADHLGDLQARFERSLKIINSDVNEGETD